jgi:hypothetical protein
VEYCFISPVVPVIARDQAIQASELSLQPSNNQTIKQSFVRHIAIGADSILTGTGVMIDNIDIEIVTEIRGDSARSTLDLLALATDDARISVEGVAKVASPYRQVSTRVDQTNILIGTGARVRGVPRLEIATDDIE